MIFFRGLDFVNREIEIGDFTPFPENALTSSPSEYLDKAEQLTYLRAVLDNATSRSKEILSRIKILTESADKIQRRIENERALLKAADQIEFITQRKVDALEYAIDLMDAALISEALPRVTAA